MVVRMVRKFRAVVGFNVVIMALLACSRQDEQNHVAESPSELSGSDYQEPDTSAEPTEHDSVAHSTSEPPGLDLELDDLRIEMPRTGDPELDQQLYDLMTSFDCRKNPHSSLCTLTEITPRADVVPDAEENILIVDHGGLLLALVRYRDRFLAFYDQNERGEFVETTPTIQVPAYVPEFQALIEDREFIPTNRLDGISEAMRFNIGDVDTASGHGGIILSFLAEHNPRARFVFMQIPTMNDILDGRTGQPVFCQKSADFVLKWAQQTASKIEDIIQTHSIRYINMSAGSTIGTIMKHYHRQCPQSGSIAKSEAENLLRAETPIYETLFNTPGVLAVQADAGHKHSRRFSFEQKNFSQRILAGGFTTGSKVSPLNPDGTIDNSRSAQDNSFVLEMCGGQSDVFVNLGLGDPIDMSPNPTPFLSTASIGTSLGALRTMIPSSSWAAPVVLSWAIHLKNTEFKDDDLFDRNTVARIKRRMTPQRCGVSENSTCKLQDPLKFGALEVNRLGYREIGESNEK